MMEVEYIAANEARKGDALVEENELDLKQEEYTVYSVKIRVLLILVRMQNINPA